MVVAALATTRIAKRPSTGKNNDENTINSCFFCGSRNENENENENNNNNNALGGGCCSFHRLSTTSSRRFDILFLRVRATGKTRTSAFARRKSWRIRCARWRRSFYKKRAQTTISRRKQRNINKDKKNQKKK